MSYLLSSSSIKLLSHDLISLHLLTTKRSFTLSKGAMTDFAHAPAIPPFFNLELNFSKDNCTTQKAFLKFGEFKLTCTWIYAFFFHWIKFDSEYFLRY